MNETLPKIESISPSKPNSIRCKLGMHDKIYVQEHRIDGLPYDKVCTRCGKEFEVLYFIRIIE